MTNDYTDYVIFQVKHYTYVDSGDLVGIEIRYGMDGPEIESRWGEIFRTPPDRPRGPHSPLYKGYRVFLGLKLQVRGVDHPPPIQRRG